MVGAVLSGGENKRFPYLKGFIRVEGRTIIERNLELLSAVADEVVISSNDPAPYFSFGVPIIGDVVEPGGPMAGIYTILCYTGAQDAIVAACDMPLINPDLLRLLAEERSGDTTVPIYGGRPQPLPAVYSLSALGVMKDMLYSGDRSLTKLLEKVDTRYVGEGEVRSIDPEGRSFININTAEDLQKVLKED